MNKKFLLTVLLLFILTGCNYNLVPDTNYKFDYAYILLPNGDVIEGEVKSWTDFEDGDQIQVNIDGKIYLTDTTRCVLIRNSVN